MSARRGLTRLLRWYPPAWRDRYGVELVALMEDSLDGGRPTAAFRCSIAWAGLRERGRAGGWIGDSAPPADRTRAGALIVLWAWTAVVVAGSAFAKESEHVDAVLSASSRTVAAIAADVIVVAAVGSAVAVALAAAVAAGPFRRFLHEGGRSALRRPVGLAAAATVVAAGLTAVVVAWARALDAAPDPGAGPRWAFVGWGAMVALSLASWTGVAVAGARRVVLGRRTLAIESALAELVAASMVVTTGAIAVWWAVVAADAPWFFSGAPPGTSAAPLDALVLVIATLLVGALAAAGYGVARIRTSRSH